MEDGKELIVDEEWYFKLLVSQGPYSVAVYQETPILPCTSKNCFPITESCWGGINKLRVELRTRISVLDEQLLASQL